MRDMKWKKESSVPPLGLSTADASLITEGVPGRDVPPPRREGLDTPPARCGSSTSLLSCRRRWAEGGLRCEV